jgi:hypothetical protein
MKGTRLRMQDIPIPKYLSEYGFQQISVLFGTSHALVHTFMLFDANISLAW